MDVYAFTVVSTSANSLIARVFLSCLLWSFAVGDVRFGKEEGVVAATHDLEVLSLGVGAVVAVVVVDFWSDFRNVISWKYALSLRTSLSLMVVRSVFGICCTIDEALNVNT